MTSPRLSLPVLLLLALGACDCGGDAPSGGECTSSADCDPGEACIDSTCVPDGDAGGADATMPPGDAGGGEDAGSCPGEACAGACCEEGERCRHDSCVPDLGACTTGDDCWSDSYCEDGECIPWEVPADRTHDDTCTRTVDIEALVPVEQCRWTGPPSGDAAPNHHHVMATPVVADLDLDGDPTTLAPSIVFASFPTTGSYSNPGVLRVIDGETCAQQLSFPDSADAVMSPASVAIGDLDADGRPEIVAAAHGGGLVAFGWDDGAGTYVRRWRSAVCDGSGGRTPDTTGGSDQWSGPSIHDLDDDALAEVVYGATVYDADGCVLSSTLGYPAYHRGVVPVVADVDEDGAMELVLGNGVWEWDAGAGDFVAESYFSGSLSHGQVAVADLGEFPLSSMGDEDRAEVVVIASGQARVQTIEGTIVFGPFTIPGGGTGGPPTIADFDGDGRREFATAGGSRYVVFDLDCVAGGDAAGCGGASRTDGVLWSQPSQDASSNVTGSSVFDFDADGAAEAVYADECYLRIYDGATGTVRFSAARSSGTTYENPVIVDVDGDFHSEIVSAVNDYAGTLGCATTDPLYPSTTFATNHGIVVLRDELDRWAASRPVWNQHAYAVTHVGDRGQTPRTSTVAVNWRDADLNNFRQNVQGDLEALGVPDLTARGERGELRVTCDDSGTGLVQVAVCNRGTLPIDAGTAVAFYEGDESGTELCRATVPGALAPGECAAVGCDATLPTEGSIDVTVIVDPDADRDECLEGNNGTTLRIGCSRLD